MLCFTVWSLSEVLGWENVCSRGHVTLPLKSEASIFSSDILPPLSASCTVAAAAQGTVGMAFTSEPISHQMSPSAASVSNSPADNVPRMLNI